MQMFSEVQRLRAGRNELIEKTFRAFRIIYTRDGPARSVWTVCFMLRIGMGGWCRPKVIFVSAALFIVFLGMVFYVDLIYAEAFECLPSSWKRFFRDFLHSS